ncbi:MAG TPA: AraC family transcriptional regulator [Puia sp.]|uniref:helix-turn-helix transcriptional regulator n=1 Tax=Puia sp. TaxID=2045100 RepID=UPI002BC00254|nr:AraC family transcriptional regulator [Puia sp.]HVU98748.1 AraC family transcriptional regulator [Puia sp.]
MADNTFPTFEEFSSLPDSEEPYVFSITLPEIKGHLRMQKQGAITLSDGGLELSGKMADLSGLRHYNDMPLVEMNFTLEGKIIQRQGHIKEELLFTKGYHNIMYNQGEWEHNRFMGGGIHNTFTVNIHIDRFAQLFAGHSKEMDLLTDNVRTQRPFLTHRPGRSFTPAMQSVIRLLWNNPFRGGLKGLYMEAKTMELLLLQWESFHASAPYAKNPWRKEDIDKLHAAKEILQQRIQDPPTLTALARCCGLNEFKLKKGFREVFGVTVFGYFNTLRLEQAHLLLRTTSSSISEIAFQTGWAHPQHFHRAFKKQYGITPGASR